MQPLRQRPRLTSGWYLKTLKNTRRAKDLAALHAVGLDIESVARADFFSLYIQVPVRFVDPFALVITDYPDAWLSRYKERGYGAIDPGLLLARTNVEPFMWSSSQPVNDDQSRLVREASEFGLCEGITFPLHGPGGASLFFSLAWQTKPHRLTASIGAMTPYIQSLATALYHACHSFIEDCNLLSPAGFEAGPTRGRELTEREQLCLLWAADGKTGWEIGKILGVSERTVNGYFGAIVFKLNALNRTHAVAKAIALGHIQPNTAPSNVKLYHSTKNLNR